MFDLTGIDHLVLRVADLPRMLRFYVEVLGCVPERRQDAIGLVQLRAGRSLIDLVSVAGPLGQTGGAAPGAQGRNLDHFCLRIEPFDEDRIREGLARHGVEAGPVERRYGAEGLGPSVYLRDPEGNVVELKGPADAAALQAPLRVARPVSDLARSAAMYQHGLGLQRIGSFSDHAGFDGVMLGAPGMPYHLEFTLCPAHPVKPAPSAEDLLVFYLPDAAVWAARCDALRSAGFVTIQPLNPYWTLAGHSFRDHDGYQVVIQRAAWQNRPEDCGASP
jgi:catechol 2,3-dioxygenase-like lactoylglutathione lyase family enzyme